MSHQFKLSAGNYDRQLVIQSDVDDLRDHYYSPVLSALKPRVVPKRGDLIIRDQRNEPSCTGFALASVIDCQNIRGGSPAGVSARMLFQMARLHDDYPDNEIAGSTLRGALKGFFHNGVCLEADAPYEYSQGLHWELDFHTAKKARNISLGAYYRLNHEINDYHAAINEAGAVMASGVVHSGWANPKNGRISYTTRSEGRHAFAIVGYTEEGFLIQNSWGDDWGGAEGLCGVALWSYQDWFENVEDAWVLRLSVSAPEAFDLKYARNHQAIRNSVSDHGVLSPRRLDVHGHYLHLDDGEFVSIGRYAQTRASVDEMVKLLRDDTRYRHLVFIAHGALSTTKDIAIRIKAWREVFKINGIYPIHIMWETGFNNELIDVVRDLLFKTTERMGTNSVHIDNRLEELARPLGHKLWRDLKTSAELTCSDDLDGGAAIKKLLCVARDRPTDLSVHFVSASAGVLILSEFLRIAQDSRGHIKSASLFAPACSISHYKEKIRPYLGRDLEVINQYSLVDKREINDSLSVYSKSLLYLVENSLEKRSELPLLGMERGVEKLLGEGTLLHHNVHFAGRDRAICDAKKHRDFDRDVKTMNHVLETILGAKPKRSQRFTSSTLSGY